jgi:hypothetical protein
MIPVAPVALSLTHTVTEIGALVAVAGLLAIAVLSLLFFTQGKEIRRLREWAGRAPERAEELAQAQRGVPVAAATPAAAAAVPPQPVLPSSRIGGVRPVPRVTPLVARAADDGSQQDGAAGTAADSGEVEAGAQPAGTPEPTVADAAAPAAAASSQAEAGDEAESAQEATDTPAAEVTPAPVTAAAAAQAQSSSDGAGETVGAPSGDSSGAEASDQAGTADEASSQAEQSEQAEAAEAAEAAPSEPDAAVIPAVPAPATAAAMDRAGASELEESIPANGIAAARLSADAPGEVVGATPDPAGAGGVVAAAAAPAGAGVAVAAGTGMAEAAGARVRPRFPPTPPPPPHDEGLGRGSEESADGAQDPPNGRGAGVRELPRPSEFRFLRDEPRRARRTWGLVAGGALAVALVVILLLVLTSGGGTTSHGSANTSSAAHHATHHAAAGTGAATSPAQLHLVVLNSTEISGLAHRVAGKLQEHGYRHAEALNGQPAGSFSTTVVEYAPGFNTAAEKIARELAIEAGAVRPMEAATGALTKGASVVVIAGGSNAATGESGASSPNGGTAGGTAGSPGAAEGGGTPAGEGGVESGTGAPAG